HQFAPDVLVDMMGPADVASCATFANPLAPDMVLGVPPLVLLGRSEKAEPEVDHSALAADHCGSARHVERTVGEAPVPGLHIEISGMERLVGLVELHIFSRHLTPRFSGGAKRRPLQARVRQ